MSERRPYLIPVVEPMDPRRANVFEHTPLSYYRYGEYPRFIRPVGAHQPRAETVWLTPEEFARRLAKYPVLTGL